MAAQIQRRTRDANTKGAKKLRSPVASSGGRQPKLEASRRSHLWGMRLGFQERRECRTASM
jgi:hypothetical protein